MRSPAREDYGHYRDQRGHSYASREDAFNPQVEKRVKISGNKKRIITSSADAPDASYQGTRRHRPAITPYGKDYVERPVIEPRQGLYRSRDYDSRPIRIPTYPKVLRKYISEQTLEYYQLPWKVAEDDPDYLIILREVDSRELDVLFEHTRRLQGKLSEPQVVIERPPPPPRQRRESPSPRRARSRTPSEQRYGRRRPSPTAELDDEAEVIGVFPPEGLGDGYEGGVPDAENGDDGEEALSDGLGDDVDVDFDVSFLPVLPGSSKGSTDMDGASIDSDTFLLSRHPPGNSSGSLEDKYILSTKWSGSTFDESDYGAKVFVSSSPPSKAKKPMLRWTHLERVLPSFDEFVSAVETVLDLSAKEKRHVRDMLRKLQKDNEQQRQHGREMKAFCEADLDIEALGEDEKHTSSICALSIPFFSLERTSASQIRSISAGSREHPSRPLLQMHTRIVNEKRELGQAITQSAPQSHYLHVAGLWCVIVNDNTLVTCSKLPMTQLSKEISFANDSDDQLSEHSVNLRAGRTRSWRLPMRISTSLPSLLSMLVDSISDLVGSGQEAVLKYRSQPIRFASWKDLMTSSSKSGLELVLQGSSSRHYVRTRKLRCLEFLKATPSSQPHATRDEPTASRSEAMPSVKSPPMNPESQAQAETLEPDHHMEIYSCSLGSSAAELSKLAAGMHQSLSSVSQKSVRDSYLRCTEASRQDVEKWIKDVNARSGEHKALLRKKLLIARASQHIAGFFWPADFDHVTTRKFWGALLTLLSGENFNAQDYDARRRRTTDADEAQEFLSSLCEHIYEFVFTFTTTFSGYEDALVALPEQFYVAWLHLVSAFALAASAKSNKVTYHYRENPDYQLQQVGQLLQEGERILTTRLRKDDIEDFEVCTSRGIVALMLDCVTRDIMNGRPDVPQSYDDYCKQLVSSPYVLPC